MNLRPYQHAAVEAVHSEWRDHPATLVVLPTGCCKGAGWIPSDVYNALSASEKAMLGGNK